MRNVLIGLFTVVLLFIAIAAFVVGPFVIHIAWTSSHSAIHEIEGLICLLGGTLALGSVTIILTLEKTADRRFG